MSGRPLTVLVALAGLLPAGRTKNRLLSLAPGWQVDPTATVRPCVLWQLSQVHLGAGSVIGWATVVRGVQDIRLEQGAVIGQLNWITAAPALAQLQRSALHLHRESALTSRHYVDCSGTLSLGELSIIAGVRSTIMTHQTDLTVAEVEPGAVVIGARCLVSTNVVITPGRRIADRCVIAAGAVVGGDLLDSGMLYGGVPARALRPIDAAGYFERVAGWLPTATGSTRARGT